MQTGARVLDAGCAAGRDCARGGPVGRPSPATLRSANSMPDGGGATSAPPTSCSLSPSCTRSCAGRSDASPRRTPLSSASPPRSSSPTNSSAYDYGDNATTATCAGTRRSLASDTLRPITMTRPGSGSSLSSVRAPIPRNPLTESRSRKRPSRRPSAAISAGSTTALVWSSKAARTWPPPAIAARARRSAPGVSAESVASSKIEGLDAGPRRLLDAEVALAEGGDAADRVAVEVLANIAAMEAAVDLGAARGSIALDDLLDIHHILMERSPTPDVGGVVRTVQNWIGGSSYNPCSASFVPPPPDHVPELLDDLLRYVNTDTTLSSCRRRSPMRSSKRSTRSPMATGEPGAR